MVNREVWAKPGQTAIGPEGSLGGGAPGPTGYAGGTCDRRGLPDPKVANPLSAACARWSICVIMRGKVALLGCVRSARPRLFGHGAVTHDVVSPRGHKRRVKKRDRAVLLVDDRVEHVTGFPIETTGGLASGST